MSPIARLPAGRRILLGVALAGMLGAASLATTAAATTSTIAVAPEATAGLGVGDTFTFRVVATATEAVSGAQATVTFDPSVVQLRSYSRGPEGAQAPLQIAGGDIPKANPPGVLQAVASAFFPPDGVAAGTSDFLVLDFQVVACGSTWLGLPVGGSVNASLLGGTPDDYGLALPLATAGGNVAGCPWRHPAPTPAAAGA